MPDSVTFNFSNELKEWMPIATASFVAISLAVNRWLNDSVKRDRERNKIKKGENQTQSEPIEPTEASWPSKIFLWTNCVTMVFVLPALVFIAVKGQNRPATVLDVTGVGLGTMILILSYINLQKFGKR